MANLITNTPRDFRGVSKRGRLDVGANVRVYVGQAMMAGTGGMVNCASGAGADFVGFAEESVNNLTNSVPHGGAARATQADLATAGSVYLSVDNLTAWTFDDYGLPVYASDGNTFTTASSASQVPIGKVADVNAAVAGGNRVQQVLVEFVASWASLFIPAAGD